MFERYDGKGMRLLCDRFSRHTIDMTARDDQRAEAANAKPKLVR
jgi:hypothetical protein